MWDSCLKKGGSPSVRYSGEEAIEVDISGKFRIKSGMAPDVSCDMSAAGKKAKK